METKVLARREQQRREENARKAKAAADRLFPDEQWILDEDGIYRSPRRPVGEKSNYKDELQDARILRDFGSTVYLVPDDSRESGKKYDAIVDGATTEFKNIRGNKNTLETQFLRSREQAPNVFINLDESLLSKQEIINALYWAKNKPSGIGKDGKRIKGYADYNRFAEGKIILKIRGKNRLVRLNVNSLNLRDK
jgi:hypothetical protein